MRVPNHRQDRLQSAVMSAAGAGQAHSLALLLHRASNTACRNTSEHLDLQCSAMKQQQQLAAQRVWTCCGVSGHQNL
jgi:ankyrin repeat protein